MYKLTEKNQQSFTAKEIHCFAERPDVVELVRYFNGRLISYKVANEQEPESKDQKKREG